MKATEGFFFRDGKVAGNVQEFISHVKEISPDVFAHHVNKERNDFYNWLKDCVDPEVADDLKKAHSQRQVVEKLTGHHWHREHKKKYAY
jgi:type IV secretory pathway TrbF-like protein